MLKIIELLMGIIRNNENYINSYEPQHNYEHL